MEADGIIIVNIRVKEIVMIDFMKLQNGSDIRGVAMEGVAGEEVNITEEVAGAIGGSFAYWLGFKVGKNP